METCTPSRGRLPSCGSVSQLDVAESEKYGSTNYDQRGTGVLERAGLQLKGSESHNWELALVVVSRSLSEGKAALSSAFMAHFRRIAAKRVHMSHVGSPIQTYVRCLRLPFLQQNIE